MPPVGFEPAIPASERPQTDAVDRAVTGTEKHCAYPQFEISLHTQVGQFRQQIAMFCVSPFCHFIGRQKSIAARSESNICDDDDADDSRKVGLLVIQPSDAGDSRTISCWFDVCVTVHHWYNNGNSQLDAIIIIIILLLIISISSTCFGRLFRPSSGALNCGIMHRRCCLQAASSVRYTTSCKHSLALLRMGEIIARNVLSWL